MRTGTAFSLVKLNGPHPRRALRMRGERLEDAAHSLAFVLHYEDSSGFSQWCRD